MLDTIGLLVVVIGLAIFIGYRVMHYCDRHENGEPKYPITYDIINFFVEKWGHRKKILLRKKIDEVLDGRAYVNKTKLDSLISNLQKELSRKQVIYETYERLMDNEPEDFSEFFDNVIIGESKEEREKEIKIDSARLNKLLILKNEKNNCK